MKEQVLNDKAINPTAQKAKDKDKGIGNGNTFNRIEIHKKFWQILLLLIFNNSDDTIQTVKMSLSENIDI